MSIILDLPDVSQEHLIHMYINNLKFYMQHKLRKDLAHKMIPSLDIAIALAEQYDSIIFNDKNNDKKDNKSSKHNKLSANMSTTSTSNKQVNKPDDTSSINDPI